MGSKDDCQFESGSDRHIHKALQLIERVKELNDQIMQNPGCPKNPEILNLMIAVEREAFAEANRARSFNRDMKD